MATLYLYQICVLPRRLDAHPMACGLLYSSHTGVRSCSGPPPKADLSPAEVSPAPVMGEEEIGVRAVEDDDVQLGVRSIRSTSSESSLMVVAVMVLMGGWSSVTRQ
jgi:hypothetical protein